jgi:hypothetical protein
LISARPTRRQERLTPPPVASARSLNEAQFRFAVDIPFVIGGAFLAVSAMAPVAPVARWLAFGVCAGLTAFAVASAMATAARDQQIGHGLLAIAGPWSLVAALTFSGPALTWLVFADAIALGALALADLTVHEATTQNVVHRLEVTGTSAAGDVPAGRIAA